LGFDAERRWGKLADNVHPTTPPDLAALGDLMTKPAGTITGEGRCATAMVRGGTLSSRHRPARNAAIGGRVNGGDKRAQAARGSASAQAMHDPLTKLANRAVLADRLTTRRFSRTIEPRCAGSRI
jgi:hypothetical protein